MLAVLSVAGCLLQTDLLPCEDWIEDLTEPATEDEWADWLEFAAVFQAARGGGTFIAGAPLSTMEDA